MELTNLSLLSSSVFSHFLIKCVIAFISEFIPNDEDEGSSPDSALGTCPSSNSEPPNQEIRREPAYFTFEF